MFEFENFVRKQFPVQAVRVTPQNIEELAESCGGKIMHDGEKEGNFSRDYIKVLVQYPKNERQTQAHIGDWLVKQGRNYKVYLDPAFRATFEYPNGESLPGGNPNRKNRGPQKKHHPQGPSPANMPKKVLVPEKGPEQEDIPAGTPVITSETVEVPVIAPINYVETPPAEQLPQTSADVSPNVDTGDVNDLSDATFQENLVSPESQITEVVSESEEIGVAAAADFDHEEDIPSPSVQHNHPSTAPCDESVCPDRYRDGEHIFTDRTIETETAEDIPTSPGPDHTPEREQLGDDELREAGFPTSIDPNFVPIYRDEIEELGKAMGSLEPEVVEEKKSITLDELNDMAGDPRSAQEINIDRS